MIELIFYYYLALQVLENYFQLIICYIHAKFVFKLLMCANTYFQRRYSRKWQRTGHVQVSCNSPRYGFIKFIKEMCPYMVQDDNKPLKLFLKPFWDDYIQLKLFLVIWQNICIISYSIVILTHKQTVQSIFEIYTATNQCIKS